MPTLSRVAAHSLGSTATAAAAPLAATPRIPTPTPPAAAHSLVADGRLGHGRTSPHDAHCDLPSQSPHGTMPPPPPQQHTQRIPQQQQQVPVPPSNQRRNGMPSQPQQLAPPGRKDAYADHAAPVGGVKTARALRSPTNNNPIREAKVQRAIAEDLQKCPRHLSDLKPETRQYLKQTFADTNKCTEQQQQGFGQSIAPAPFPVAGSLQLYDTFIASMGMNRAAMSGIPPGMQMPNRAAMSNSTFLEERMGAFGCLPALDGMPNRTMMPQEQAMFEQMAMFRAMEAQAAQTAEKTMEAIGAQAARSAEKRCEEIRPKNLTHKIENSVNTAKRRATPAKPTKGRKSKASKRKTSSAKSSAAKSAASVPDKQMLSAKGIIPTEESSAGKSAVSVPNKTMLSAKDIVPTEALPTATKLARAVTSDDENKSSASEKDASSPPLISLKRLVSVDDCFRSSALRSVPEVRSSEKSVEGGRRKNVSSSQSASRQRRLPVKKRGRPSTTDRPEEGERQRVTKKAAVDSSTGGADADCDMGYSSSPSSKVDAAAAASSEPFDLLINAAVSRIQLIKKDKESHGEDVRHLIPDSKADGKLLWDHRYDELKAFAAMHGHCNVPADRKKYGQLRDWVYSQRYRKKLLSPLKIQLLDDIGFVWKKQTDWEKRYEQLKSLAETTGSVASTRDKDLLQWVRNQRKEYALKQQGKKTSLSDEREKKLSCLPGFSWNKGKEKEKMWWANYKLLKEFHEEHGHCKVSNKKHRALALWVMNRRKDLKLFREGKKSAMTKERQLALELLGFK